MELTLAVPVSVLVFFLTAFVWPLVRLWRRTGTFAMAFKRNPDPIQRLVGAAIAGYMTGLCVWAAFFAGLGPTAFGGWTLPPALSALGWGVWVVGLGITVTAQAQMGLSWRMGVDPATTALITAGLFQFSRNPIYTGMLTTLAAYVLISPSPYLVMGWLQFGLLISLQTRYEEKALILTHGATYLDYAARVGRFFPGLGKLTSGAAEPVLGS